MIERQRELDPGKAIIAAAQDVFSTMLMLDVEGEDVSDLGRRAVQSNMTSMIGLGGGLRGMLAVHCPSEAARTITEALLGMEVEDLGDDVRDAIGEIANMVAGNLKVAYAGHDIDIELAIPTSVIGDSFRISGISGASRHCISFNLDGSSFWIELLYVLA